MLGTFRRFLTEAATAAAVCVTAFSVTAFSVSAADATAADATAVGITLFGAKTLAANDSEVFPANAETPCSFQEMGFSLSNPPQVLTIGFCDAINITINVSGIRPTVSEPNPSLATTDGLEATEGVVLVGDFMPLRMDDGRTYRVARIIPMREGTAEITFYNFDGSVRAVTKVTVNP